MLTEARVVVIGGGNMGAGVLYHLALRTSCATFATQISLIHRPPLGVGGGRWRLESSTFVLERPKPSHARVPLPIRHAFPPEPP